MGHLNVTSVTIGEVTGFYTIWIGEGSKKENLRIVNPLFPLSYYDQSSGKNKKCRHLQENQLPWWKEENLFNSVFLCLADWMVAFKAITS